MASTAQHLTDLVRELDLPADYAEMFGDIHRPLARRIADRHDGSPLLVSINGAQGTGKSTLATFLKHILETGHGLHVAVLSIDDFYLGRESRRRLAQRVHPLFVTRGVPGTHDLAQMEDVIGGLLSGRTVRIPRFDKATDEPLPASQWQRIGSPVDVVLFEGWCNSSPVQTVDELREPVNALEAEEDPQGVWRRYSNDRLAEYHARVFEQAGITVMLQVPDFEMVFRWRRLQEQKLRERLPEGAGRAVMDDAALRHFIRHFERITRHTLATLPSQADIVIPVDEAHRMTVMLEH